MNEELEEPIVSKEEKEKKTAEIKLVAKSLWLVASCLAVVVLVMSVALAVLVGVAYNTQSSEDRAIAVAEALQDELTCRSDILASADIARGNVISLVSLTIVVRAEGDAEKLKKLIDQIEVATTELTVATAAASTVVEDCMQETPSEGS